MNPGRYFIPSVGMRMRPMLGSNYLPNRGIGLFGSIKNSLKGFNWGGILNGANKTLNVFNQTIPLIRQAKPMFNNMRSMMQLAKAFGSETTSNRLNRNSTVRSNNHMVNSNLISNHNVSNTEKQKKKEVENNNFPNFFI